jgi:hypothetical protein
MQRGVELDRQRAITGSQNQFAQLGAGYASALGQAGLGARQQGAQIGANLGSQQLGFQASTMAPYPNASLYANLAQMAGANQQRTQAQGQFDQLARPGGAGFSQGGMGVGGGRADNTPFKGPTMMDHGGGMVGGYGGGGFGNFGGFAGGSAPAPYQPPPEWGFSGGAFDPGSEFNPSQGGLGVPEAPWQGSGEGNLSSDPYSGAMSGEGLYDYQTPFYG